MNEYTYRYVMGPVSGLGYILRTDAQGRRMRRIFRHFGSPAVLKRKFENDPCTPSSYDSWRSFKSLCHFLRFINAQGGTKHTRSTALDL